MPDFIGKSIGRYHILEQLDKGGMAIVYKAYDTRLEREVALKVIRREAFPPEHLERLLTRFKREAKVLAKLAHPNIVKVLDYGEEDGTPYLVMEYIPGGTLKERIKRRDGKPLPWRDAAGLLAPIARALKYAHQQEGTIIHRDVKPSNILITQNGHPMLTDFGIAKVLEIEETQELTGTGVGVGTPEYMAPEQSGKGMDHRVDIYALGTVFYEMVTGRRPFEADTPLAVMIKKNKEALPRPSVLVPGLPESVEYILVKALATNPEGRYNDMGKLADVLEGLAQGTLPNIIPPKKKRPVWFTWAVGAAGLGFISFMVIAGLAINWLINQNEPDAQTSTPDVVIVPDNPFDGEATTIPDNSTESIPEIETSPASAGDEEFVFVPEGEFIMGSDPNDPFFWGAEAPKHTVYLDAFWIQRTEVTNAMYRACVNEGVCPPPTEPSTRSQKDYYILNNYPVVHVTYSHAVSYCTWIGGRLPTEAEWEKAARGTDGALYPWGNASVDNSSANFCDIGCTALSTVESGYNDGYPELAPVGSYPKGASPYGALDMAGNVLEWVSDWYAVDYYASSPSNNPTGPSSGSKHPVRGGSWSSLRDGLRPSARTSKEADYSSDIIGFRCAMDSP